MKTCIIFQLGTLFVFLLGSSTEGLFFQYPKNALVEFFQSLYGKKKMEKPLQNIHHYHLHYYPIHTNVLSNPVRAPNKFELDKVYSNHLENLGWSDKEYKRVPEPDVYRPAPLSDSWPESSLTRNWAWDEVPDISNKSVEQPVATKPGIIVQVPLHQNIILQHPPPKEEKPDLNPLATFFRKIKRIKNSFFSNHADARESYFSNEADPRDSDYWDRSSYSDDNMNAYVVYVPPVSGGTL